MLKSIAPALVVILLLAACAPSAPPAADVPADQQAIAQLRQQELDGIAAGDTSLAYATDALFLMPPNAPAAAGKAAARRWFQETMAQFRLAVTYTSAEVEVAGDLAVERYTGSVTFTPVAGGAAMQETFKGLHVYRRQPDGQWKMTQDIWNSDMPLPGM